MTQEQVRGLLQMQSGLQVMVAQFAACRNTLSLAFAGEEAAFIRDEIERLNNALELTEREAMAVANSLQEKIIEAFGGEGGDSRM